jgi:hypothetical protein
MLPGPALVRSVGRWASGVMKVEVGVEVGSLAHAARGRRGLVIVRTQERLWLSEEKAKSQARASRAQEERAQYLQEVKQLTTRRFVKKCARRWRTFVGIRRREHAKERRLASMATLSQRRDESWAKFQTQHSLNLYSMYYLRVTSIQMEILT